MSRLPFSPVGLELSQQEFDLARLEILRRRVRTFGAVVGALLVLLAGIQYWISSSILSRSLTRPELIGAMAGVLVGLALTLRPLLGRPRFDQSSLRSLVRRTIWIVTMAALSQTRGARLLTTGINEALQPLGFTGTIGPVFVLSIFMVVLHTTAAIMVPWTIREACVPPLAWAGFTLLASLGDADSGGGMLLGVSLTLASGLPGVAISFFRAGSLRETLGLRLIGARYAEVERELSFARRLHESLFPKPILQGPIRLEYAYEPMRQIGGDFLDVTRAEDGSLMIVMIDVTGHGVAAALAVNRLHGEMKRVLGEAHNTSPSQLIGALNRYVHLTLADESVFATAVAVRVWPDGRARVSNAGHPPPLLKTSAGLVSGIEPTGAILGPFAPDEYSATEVEIDLMAGASLTLYTDGASECRDAKGVDLGQGALEGVAARLPASQSLPEAILDHVRRYRGGPVEDDVLIATIACTGHSKSVIGAGASV